MKNSFLLIKILPTSRPPAHGFATPLNAGNPRTGVDSLPPHLPTNQVLGQRARPWGFEGDHSEYNQTSPGES
ncbi:hypothetical protein L8106_02457 [Lyngbya sp. PCC 8106]|nr:hypothetical protein L8106_02457 [Lyngbya sp. PCC 8106]